MNFLDLNWSPHQPVICTAMLESEAASNSKGKQSVTALGKPPHFASGFPLLDAISASIMQH
jgi:hypothetical protein